MTWRFRKRIKILPGLWINLSKGTPSWSIGGKGITANVGKRGLTSTVGLPGSGLSYRFAPKRKRTKSVPAPVPYCFGGFFQCNGVRLLLSLHQALIIFDWEF